MKTRPEQNTTESKISAIKIENPLGLFFETPKSEENLRSATLYEPADKAPNAERPTVSTEAGTVSAWGSYTVSIAQVLG
ncbi:hypothetical protein BLAT2472_70159 [Burkholderia latens]